MCKSTMHGLVFMAWRIAKKRYSHFVEHKKGIFSLFIQFSYSSLFISWRQTNEKSLNNVRRKRIVNNLCIFFSHFGVKWCLLLKGKWENHESNGNKNEQAKSSMWAVSAFHLTIMHAIENPDQENMLTTNML